MTLLRILAIVAAVLLQSGSTDAQDRDRPRDAGGSILHLTLDFDALTDEWLDRQQIESPIERELWKFLSGPFNRTIVDAAQGRKHYVVAVDFLHDSTLPERRLSVRPDDSNADPLVLIAYRSLQTTVGQPEALMTVLDVEQPTEPNVLLTAQLRYDGEKSLWDVKGRSGEIDKAGIPASKPLENQATSEQPSAGLRQSQGATQAPTSLKAAFDQYYREVDSYTAPVCDSIIINSDMGVSFEFVYIPPGKYTVGRNIGQTETFLRLIGQQASSLDEGPQRQITFDHGFYLARRQTTAAQFAVFLNDIDSNVAADSIVLNTRSNLRRDGSGQYSAKDGADRFPANTVTWSGAIEFTKWLSKKSGWSLRLPTEDEWEAAARTQKGLLAPTGGLKPPTDPQTGLVPGIRPGSPDANVDAFPENMTVNGLFHTFNWVGDWTSSVYKSDREEDSASLIDALVVQREGGHVLKGRGGLTGRTCGDDVGENGIFGFRVLLEANASGSPVRTPTLRQGDRN
jgi:formylglycine-generating enzyme required for sulfatase activity